MTDLAQQGSEKVADGEVSAHRVRLPGFLIDKEMGLGDLIKRATYTLGVQPCGACEKRAAALNRWMFFSRYHRH